MIHIVTSENADDYKDLLDDMFVWRHRIYVEQRGWKEIARPDGREIDQFDNSDAVYLLALDDAGRFAGSARINSTLGPTLLTEVYPHLVIRGNLPQSPTIWDLTRVFVVPDKRQESGRSPVLEELYAGIMEWAIEQQATSLITLAEIFWLPRGLRMGWVVDPLGLPTLIEGEYWVPLEVEVGEQFLEATRQAFHLPNTSVFAERSSTHFVSTP